MSFNSRRGRRRYKLSDEEAYALLPAGLQKALQDSLTEWSSNWVLREWKRQGVRATIEMLRNADANVMFEGFIPARRRDDMPILASTYIAAQVPPLYLYEVDDLVEMVEGAPPIEPSEEEVEEEIAAEQIRQAAVGTGKRKSGMRWVKDDGGRVAAGYRGKTGDCVCRSISIATGKAYQEVYDAINALGADERTGKRKKGKSHARTGVYSQTIRKYMASIGWKWTPCMSIGSGTKVHLRDGELPMGRLVVSVSRHTTAVLDGVIHDTHDPSRKGTRCVYGYFSNPTREIK